MTAVPFCGHELALGLPGLAREFRDAHRALRPFIGDARRLRRGVLEPQHSNKIPVRRAVFWHALPFPGTRSHFRYNHQHKQLIIVRELSPIATSNPSKRLPYNSRTPSAPTSALSSPPTLPVYLTPWFSDRRALRSGLGQLRTATSYFMLSPSGSCHSCPAALALKRGARSIPAVFSFGKSARLRWRWRGYVFMLWLPSNATEPD